MPLATLREFECGPDLPWQDEAPARRRAARFYSTGSPACFQAFMPPVT